MNRSGGSCLLQRLRPSRPVWLPLLLVALHAWLPWAHAGMGPGSRYAIVCSAEGTRLMVLAPARDAAPAQEAGQASNTCPWCLGTSMPGLPVHALGHTVLGAFGATAVAGRADPARPTPVRTWAFASRAPPAG